MVIDAIGKKRDDRQKKELENKADTDLLTGLNNKRRRNARSRIISHRIRRYSL